MGPVRAAIVSLLFCAAFCCAQQSGDRKASEDAVAKAPPAATVSGHVYLDDTKGPCRKATVYLEPAGSLQAAPGQGRAGQIKEPARAGGPVTAGVETLFDGSYSFTHVAPGSYYVIASCPGYISPYVALALAEGRGESDEAQVLTPEQKAAKDRVLDALPRVDVAIAPATADITLERGGAVSGNMAYDDGTPAVGLTVHVLTPASRDSKETWSVVPAARHFIFDEVHTDDRGNYRISGLPPGKYTVEAALDFSTVKMYFSGTGGSSSSNGGGTHLAIYAGNTPHKKDAASFTLRAQEERSGEDIVVPISKLHSIRGTIVAARDGHLVNSGGVKLLNASDGSMEAYTNLTEDDPSFTFGLIFEGDYILESDGAADVDFEPLARSPGSFGQPQFKMHTVHFYGRAAIPLHVEGDIDGVTIPVREPTAQEAKTLEQLLQEEEQQPPIAPQ